MPGKRGARRPVIWFPFLQRGSVVASLAADGQVLVTDEPLDHPGSGEDYGPGAIVGLRIRATISAAADMTTGQVLLVVLILPQGLATPTVNTNATLKQNEKYVWGVFKMEEYSSTGAAALTKYRCEIAPKTARRFEPGDRLCVIVVNNTSIAFAAGAGESLMGDAYLRED